MPIMDLESCKKGYKDGNEDALITGDTFCGGLLNKDGLTLHASLSNNPAQKLSFVIVAFWLSSS